MTCPYCAEGHHEVPSPSECDCPCHGEFKGVLTLDEHDYRTIVGVGGRDPESESRLPHRATTGEIVAFFSAAIICGGLLSGTVWMFLPMMGG